MKPTMRLRMVPASDYMVEGYYYENTMPIPHLKLQQWFEDLETLDGGEVFDNGEWRDVPIEGHNQRGSV